MNATPVVRVDPRVDPRWAGLAAGPRGGLFTSPPWIGAVSATYGFVPSARVAVDAAGTPLAGLAWMDIDDIRGARRLALPFCDRADPIVADVDGWTAVTADALAGDLPFTLRCLDTSVAAADPRLVTTGEAAWHSTPLQGSLDALHARFQSPTRRNIATAERAGVEVVLSAEMDAVAEFHRMHVALRRHKYRLLAQPREFFENIWKAFAPTDSLRTALALVDGRPVAGALYLIWQDVVYYKFGASDPATLPLRPNDAIHWAVMRWAHDRGIGSLDWGISGLDQPGLVAYKRKWGTVEGRVRTLNAGGAPLGRRAATDRLLDELTALFVDDSVPDSITERAGAALYRYFC